MIQGIPFWYGMGKAGLIGGVTAEISFGIGSLATSTFSSTLTVGKALFEAGLHAINGGIMSAIEGGKFFAGALSGLVSSAISSGVQALGGLGKGISILDADQGIGVATDFGSRNPTLLKAIMITSGGLSGGISASIAGGNFWQGMRQGLITTGLNHVAHLGYEAIEQRITRQQALAAMKEQYPRFYEVLAKLQDFLEANPKVLSTLSEDSGISKAKILQMMDIKSPEGQIILLARMKDLGQSAYPKSYISADLVKKFETLQTPEYIQGTSFLLAVTTLHEFVHWRRAYNILSSDCSISI